MNLTEPMSRELLWLYANKDELSKELFAERRELYEGDPMDLGLRYVHLEQVGYVDTVLRVWDGGIGYARLTEEGRFAAEAILEEDLRSAPVPDDVKESALAALASGSIAAAAQILLRFLGLA